MHLQPLGASAPLPSLELHRSEVHHAPLTALCVLRDGASAIVGTADGTLIRLSVATGEVLEREQAHQGPITHVVRRGRTVVSSSGDRTVRVWTDDPLRLRRVHDEHLHAVRQVAVSDTHLVTVGDDAVVRVFDIVTGTLHLSLPGHQHPVRVVAMHDNLAVTGSIDHRLRVWDVRTGEALPSLGEPAGPVRELDGGRILRGLGAAPTAIAFPYPHRVFVASGTEVREWDLSTRTNTSVLSGLAWPIETMTAHDDHLVVATATEIRGVQADQGDRIRFRCAAPPGGTAGLALAGERLVVAGRDGTVRVLDMSQWRPTERHVAPAVDACVSPDGTVAATVDHNHEVRLWSVATGTPRALLDGSPEPGAPAVAFSADGQLVATGRRHGSPAVHVHHHDGRPAIALDHRKQGQAVPVQTLTFAWDGVLVGPHGEGPIQWWGLDGTSTRTLYGTTGHVQRMTVVGHQLVTEACFAPSPDQPSIPHLQVWNLWRQCLTWSVPGHVDEHRIACGFGPIAVLGANAVLTGTGRSPTELGSWDLERGQLRAHVDLLHPWTAVAARPDGAVHVVAVDPGQRVHELVQLDAGLSVVLRRPLPERASCTALAPEADRLAWAEGGTVVVTELVTGAELARTTLDESEVSSLALTFDGRSVVVGGASGQVHVLRLT